MTRSTEHTEQYKLLKNLQDAPAGTSILIEAGIMPVLKYANRWNIPVSCKKVLIVEDYDKNDVKVTRIVKVTKIDR